MQSFEWFVAWRYLVSRERKTLVSLITFISMAGVAVGVAALIVVLGVMDGADDLLFGKVSELYPHLRIVAPQGPIEQFDEGLLARLGAMPEVENVEPIMEKMAFINAGSGIENDQQTFVRLIGVGNLGPGSLYALGYQSDQGAVELGEREILLGIPLAARLGITGVGQEVMLVSTSPVRTAIGFTSKYMKFKVKDAFRSDFYEFDANTAFISPAMMRKMFPTSEGYDYIHVKLKDPFKADALAEKLELPAGYTLTTWSQENGAFFSALKLEKLALFVILLLIILVAALNIIGTLILMVSDKTREIGILKAIGASRRTISRIFLLDGVLIGMMGTGIGMAVGLVICALIPYIPLDMPAAIYNFDHLPVNVRPLTVVVIVLSSLLICTLAAVFPALHAARLKPVEALRYD